MVEIKLPYDKKTIVAKIPDENFAGLFTLIFFISPSCRETT